MPKGGARRAVDARIVMVSSNCVISVADLGFEAEGKGRGEGDCS